MSRAAFFLLCERSWGEVRAAEDTGRANALVAAGVVLLLPLSGAAQALIVAAVSTVVGTWAFFGPAAAGE